MPLLLMNLNKGCIEIGYEDYKLINVFKMNLNKGCIEIIDICANAEDQAR